MANIIFMGTPEFAVPALQALHAVFGVQTVVSAPDKPRGRGQHVSPSAVKQAALELGITDILQPTSLKDPSFAQELAERSPDVICVIAFRILPRSVYGLATKGTFNVHASLLPKFRGAAPINHAIMHGETHTGVTSFLLNDVVDTGTVLLQRTLDINENTTAGELYSALMPLAAECAVETCRGLLDGSLTAHPQNELLASPAPKVYRETSAIDWTKERVAVRNFIHGLSPSPCAWTFWSGETLKIYRASLCEGQGAPGSWRMRDGQFQVACADGMLSLDELQMPGKRRMTASDVVRGYRGSTEGSFL
ncbi:MAG: methionyl-tRNA formyltransferase [Candidatus Kapabacteria bacterium]|nr:methionyl-tRNA formyltransferase [Candidatus Kapabacteria bacterium]